MRMFGFLVLVCTVFAAGLPVRASGPLAEDQYVTVKNGHLFYNGGRLRLWGTNFCYDVKRQGKDLELSFDRMVDAGFNGIRLNMVEHGILYDPKNINTYSIPATVKGTDSPMERLDYSIHLARQRGMFFWFSLGHSKPFLPADYDVMPDDGTRKEWLKMGEEVHSLAVYVDERAEKVYQEFARNILEHVNPYTGKRYADEEAIALYELTNEDCFVEEALSRGLPGLAGKKLAQKWNTWLKARYKTEAELLRAWGNLSPGESLDKGTIVYQPILEGVETSGAGVQKEFPSKDKKNLTRYPYQRGEDLTRFVCETYQESSRRIVKFVRSLGKPGKGISVVPITPTGRYGRSIPAYYSAAGEDFVSTGFYGFALRPWEVKKENPCYPYVVRSNYHPLLEQPVDLFRVKGKPYLFYECNDTRPNPYVVEFPARVAAYAVWQDTDGAFWAHWDSHHYLPDLKTDEDYIRRRMPIPDKSYPNAGILMSNDEVLLAAVKAAGTLFKNANVPPAANPVQAVIGKDILFNLRADLQAQMDGGTNLENLLREKAWRYGLRITYDPNGPSRLPSGKEPHGFIQMGPSMQWFWNGTDGHFRVDGPSAKMYTGFLKPFLDFKGLKITGIDRTWGTISIIAEDGLPLEKSASILVTAVSRNRNTGMKITPESLNTKDYFQQGMAQMCGVPGEGPPIVDRIAATFRAPWLKGLEYKKFNFVRNCYERGTVGETFELTGDEPLFYARLTRPHPPVIRKIVVTGNSLTFHPPLANSDWNNSWGMAASSQDKDYAHLIYTYIAKTQKEKPELIIENLYDPLIVDPAKHQQLASHKADLYIIEIGDNLKDDESNEKTLGGPYEELLKAIKKANPEALIFCTSTWGGSQKKDPLMRAACERQNVPFIRIDIFIGDEKNRAISEGHFKHGGVNWHPGDRGMNKIAGALWQTIKPALKLNQEEQ